MIPMAYDYVFRSNFTMTKLSFTMFSNSSEEKNCLKSKLKTLLALYITARIGYFNSYSSI